MFAIFALSLGLATLEPATVPVAMPQKPSAERIVLYQYLAGAASAAVTVPLTLLVATWLGGLSSNLVWALVPSLLVLLALPPLVVTGASYWAANAASPGAVRFWPAFGATVAAQAAIVVVATLIGVSSRDVGAVAALTGVEMVVLPGVNAGTSYLTRPQPMPSLSRGGFVAPVFAWSF